MTGYAIHMHFRNVWQWNPLVAKVISLKTTKEHKWVIRSLRIKQLHWFSPSCWLPTGPTRYRSHRTVSRNQPSLVRATRGDRTAHPMGVSNTRTHRRAPQSSSGPRQPERASALSTLLERRRQMQAKPQSDQRKRNAQKLSKCTPLLLQFIGKFCSMWDKCINCVCNYL